MDCIFCRIIKGEISAHKVYEDDFVFSFLDIKPKSLGHTLVIPKKHCQDFNNIEEEDLKNFILGVKKTIQVLKFPEYRLVQNTGPLAGQEVFHLHFHIIPKREGEKEFYEYKEGEMESFINNLKV